MRVVLVPVGSSGEVLPFVALGAEMRRRGHDVHLIANPYFQKVIAAERLTLAPFGERAQYLAVARDPRLWHRRKGFRVIASDVVGPTILPIYEQVPPCCRLVETPPLRVAQRQGQAEVGAGLVAAGGNQFELAAEQFRPTAG